MIHVDVIPVAIAAVATVVFSAVYYSVVAGAAAAVSPAWADRSEPQAWLLPFELLRSLVVAVVVAALVALVGVTDTGGAVLLAVALWVAFPVVLLAGSVVHERVPRRLAAIHAGDWLAKLLIITVVAAVFG